MKLPRGEEWLNVIEHFGLIVVVIVVLVIAFLLMSFS